MFILPSLIRSFQGLPFFFEKEILSQSYYHIAYGLTQTTPTVLSLLLDVLANHTPQFIQLSIIVASLILFFLFYFLKELPQNESPFFFLVLVLFSSSLSYAFLAQNWYAAYFLVLFFAYKYANVFFTILVSMLDFAGGFAILVLRPNLKQLIGVLTGAFLSFTFGFSLTSLSFSSFFEFGDIAGVSFFLALFAVVGFSLRWEKQKRENLALLVIVVASFFSSVLFVPGILIIIFYGAFFIHKLYLFEWSNSYFKISTILLIYFLVFSSFIVYSQTVIDLSPNTDELLNAKELELELMEYIFFDGNQKFVLFSIKSYENILRDSEIFNSLQISDFDRDILYYNRDMSLALSKLAQYNITHIYVTPQMKNGEVWQSTSEGLLFLLQDGTMFTQVPLNLSNQGQLYEVTGIYPKVYNE